MAGTLSFLDRLEAGKTLVADGATGTNLQARGLTRGKPSETWLLEKPEEIEALESEFIAAGADIILTCTFSASPLRLVSAGLAGRAAEINCLAVETARRAAAGTPVLVAGSIGPSGQLLKPLGPLEAEQAQASFSEQAQALVAAGVDILVIETQFDLKEAEIALQAVRALVTIPVVVSFSYDRGTRTMMGVKPSQMAQKFNDLGADVLGINCGRSLEENYKALQELRAATSLPIWFKPNAGMPAVDALGNAVYDLTPEAMGALAPSWVAAGAAVVGGCCGTSPQHLEQVARAVK